MKKFFLNLLYPLFHTLIEEKILSTAGKCYFIGKIHAFQSMQKTLEGFENEMADSKNQRYLDIMQVSEEAKQEVIDGLPRDIKLIAFIKAIATHKLSLETVYLAKSLKSEDIEVYTSLIKFFLNENFPEEYTTTLNATDRVEELKESIKSSKMEEKLTVDFLGTTISIQDAERLLEEIKRVKK